MSIWDKYKLDELPEEVRAETIKTVVHEVEETARAKYNNSWWGPIRIWALVALVAISVVTGISSYEIFEGWKELQIKKIQPMVVCPPVVCPAPPPPEFDIHLAPKPPAPQPAK